MEYRSSKKKWTGGAEAELAWPLQNGLCWPPIFSEVALNKPSLLSRLTVQHRVAGILLMLAAVMLAVAIISSLVFGSCVPAGKPQSGLETAVLKSGAVEILVELAVSQSEQETGLMHRKELADGRGMLVRLHR